MDKKRDTLIIPTDAVRVGFARVGDVMEIKDSHKGLRVVVDTISETEIVCSILEYLTEGIGNDARDQRTAKSGGLPESGEAAAPPTGPDAGGGGGLARPAGVRAGRADFTGGDETSGQKTIGPASEKAE